MRTHRINIFPTTAEQMYIAMVRNHRTSEARRNIYEEDSYGKTECLRDYFKYNMFARVCGTS